MNIAGVIVVVKKWLERETKHYLPVELRLKIRGDFPPYPDVST
jgi:hypothetical protein